MAVDVVVVVVMVVVVADQIGEPQVCPMFPGVTSIAESRASFPVVVHMLLQRPAIGSTASQASELLLLRRANTGFMDGYFSLPGGHVEPGELPIEAVKREVLEEVGVMVQTAAPLLILPYRSGRHLGYNFVFTSECWQGQARIAEPQASDLLCWVPPTALPKPYPPWLNQVLVRRAALGDEAGDGAGDAPPSDWYAELDYNL